MTISLTFNSEIEAIQKTPKLTVVFVADALSEEIVEKVEPFLKGGIKFLRNNGVNFTNAFHASGNCSSAVGHADFMTGAFPTSHGLVGNSWLDSNNRLFSCYQDKDVATAGVFDPVTGLIYGSSPAETNQSIIAFYGVFTFLIFGNVYGVSPRNYKADTVADQLVLNSNPQQPTKVYSIAKQAFEAVLMGGQLAHVFWMDGPTGLFTTSKYYFPGGLPDWVVAFNNSHPIPPTFIWESVYPLGSPAYNFPSAQDYQFSYIVPGVLPVQSTVLGQELQSVIPPASIGIGALGALNYNIGPLGVQRTFEFAKEVINRELNLNSNERLVIFLNIDSVDGTSTVFGMQSQDNIDMVYRIDKELSNFLEFIYKKVPRSEVAVAFVADEGNMGAIPELLQQSGFGLARRTLGDNLVTQFNTALGANYVQTILPPFLYLNLTNFIPLPPATQATVLSQIKDLLRSTPGIKDAWTFDELISWPFEHEDLGRFFKLQLYRNLPATLATPQERRSGEIVFQTTPFNLVTVSAIDPMPTRGQGHISVYNYDSHVPLYFYQHGKFARKTVSTPVLMQQFAVSLADILNVPRPSAAPPEIHPLPFISNQAQ
jgi:hypothetical protein